MPGPIGKSETPRPRWRVWFGIGLAIYSALFLLYAETWAFTWDESYHLLAAQLVLKGRRPYLDFCFPQTLLGVYWNAGWMALLGQSWRVAHAVAGLLAVGGVALTAAFAARRFPDPAWRTAAAWIAAAVTGLNILVFTFGPVAQPYGFCLCALAAALWMSARAVETSGGWAAAAAGLFAGAAAGSSLLTAAAIPVLGIWIPIYSVAGGRWRKLAAFALGTAVPFLPELWLFTQGPRQTWFNLFQYHFHFRKLYWPETTRHDLEVLTSWMNSAQGLALGLLAIVGLVFVARRSGWPRAVKAEFYLCGWLALALSAEMGRAHPTFPQYFLLTTPFLAILAAAGAYAVASRNGEAGRPGRTAALVCAIIALSLGRSMYDRREFTRWSDYEPVAAAVNRVTPPDAPLFAYEPIYFLTRRTPPPGLELYYTHKLQLPADERARLHIVTEEELQRQVASGRFPTAAACEDKEIERYDLEKFYRRKEEVGDCVVFWDWRPL